MLNCSYCAFISTLSVAGISERFKISIFKGFVGLAGTVAQGDDLSGVGATVKAQMRYAELAAFSGSVLV